MNKFLKLTIIFLLTLFTTLTASEKETKNIAKISAASLYNIDKNSLQKTINAYIETHPNLKALQIVEVLSGETYYKMFKDNENIYFDKPFSNNIKQYSKFTTKSKYENEVVGEITAYFHNENLIPLTDKEKEFIANNPTIVVQNERAMAPLNFHEFGQAKGFSVELMEMVAKKTGLKIKYLHGPSWKMFIDMMKSNKLDVMLNIVKNKERSEFMDFTDPYINIPHGIIVKKKDSHIKSLNELIEKKKTISFVKGYFYEPFMKKNYPQAKIKFVNNDFEALHSLAYGDTDAVLGVFPNMQYTARKNHLPEFHYFSDPSIKLFKPIETRFGVNKNKPELFSILQKGLAAISEKEKTRLSQKWLQLNKEKFVLTENEKKWLKENPYIKIAMMTYWDTNDNAESLHTDLIKLLNKYGDLNIVAAKYSTWKEGYTDAIDGNVIHGILNLAWSQERENKYFNYVKGYNLTPAYLVVKKDNTTIKKLDDLINKTVYIKQKDISKIRLANISKDIKTIELNDTIKILEALESKDEADAAIVSTIDLETIKKYDLKVSRTIYDKYNLGHLGINLKHKELISILKKVFNIIPEQELRKIQNKIYKKTKASSINLTHTEKAWLKKHPTVNFTADPIYLPYEAFTKDGKYIGMVSEYLKIIENMIGIKFNKIATKSWTESLEKAKNKEVDILSNYTNDGSLEDIHLSTKPYIASPIGVFTRKNLTKIQDLNELKNKQIAIVEGYGYLKNIFKDYPDLQYVKVKNARIGLMGVSSGKYDAMICSTTLGIYKIADQGLHNLHIAMQTDYMMELGLGIRKDWKPLVNIINKAISAIPKGTSQEITKKWIGSSTTYKKPSLNLTQEEKKWIKENKVKVGVEDWPPVYFSNTGKDLDGIAGDVFNRIVKLTGLKVEIVHDLWEPLLTGLRDKKIDILPATYYTDERATYGLYTSEYVKMFDYIYIKEDNNEIKSMADLNGKKLAIVKEYGTIPKVRKKFPKIEIVETINLEDSIKKVLNGDVDALFEGQVAVEYKTQEKLITGLKGVPQFSFEASSLHMFVRDDKPILQKILQKALNSIEKNEINKIKSNWLTQSIKKNINLTKQEQDWLSNEIPLKYVFDPNREPFEYINDLGLQSGVIVDILSKITEISSLKFEPVKTKNWAESVSLIKDQKAHMHTMVIENEKRKEYLNFSDKVLFKTPVAFVTKQSDKKIYENVKFDLADKKIGIIKAKAIHKRLIKKYPNFNFVEVASVEDGFRKILSGQIDLFAVNQSTAIYYIKAKGFNDVKIATTIDTYFEYKIAVQKTLPNEVISIINKSLDAIGEKEINKIYNDYVNVKIEKDIDWSLIWKILILVAIVGAGLIYWNRKLNQKVTEKTAELSMLLESFDENVVALKADLDGNITYVSHALCNMSGYSAKELIGKSHKILKDPTISEEFLKQLLTRVKKEKIWKGETRNKSKAGEYYWVYGVITPEYDSTHKLIGYSDIKHDITAQKEVENLSSELQKTLENFDDNVIASRSDLKGNITYASKAFAQITGYSIDELIGKPHSTVRHPDTPKEIFKDLWNTIQNGKIWRGEIKNRKKDGGFYWVDAVITPEFDENNMIIAYSAIRHDITAQKEVEELSETLEHKVEERTSELKESQEQFSSMASNVPGVIYRCKVDDAWTVLYISNEIEKLSGYPVNDFINNSVRSFADIMNPKDIERVANLIQSQIDKGEKFLVDYRVISKDGEEKWVRSQGQSIIVNDELCIDGVLFDFTEQRALEEIIKQNTEQMTYVSQNANLGFWNFNPQIGDLYVNNVFVEMLGYKAEEVLIEGYENEMFKPFKDGLAFWEQLLHPEDAKRTGEIITAHINGETDLYNVEYRMRRADGSWMWSRAVGRISKFDENGKPIKFDGVNIDIDDAKTAQQEINNQKQYIDAIMNSQSNIVLSTDGEKIRTANQALLDFYNIESIEEFLEKFGNCICDTFDTDAPKEYLQKMMGEEKWIEYVYNRPDQIHKARITQNGKQNIFTITSDKFTIGNESLETAVFTNITELEKIREEVEAMHKHTQSSIEYASLIQHSLIPENDLFKKYFDDYLTIWHPKDIVGGDVYLFDELRDDNECLLIVIDCTGHGVPGAFVTMLVKAIERQIAAIIGNNPTQEVSPAWILQYFNHTMKHLLKQEDDDAISNAGFDGGILYYNKKENIIKFAGAEIPLFYLEPEATEYKVIKGDRHSIGYKKSDADYQFKDHLIEAKEGMQFYLTTDGYIDQNGGEKGFPFGKKRFKALLQEYAHEPFSDQQEVLLDSLAQYQKDEERNDDITVVGVKIGKSSEPVPTENMMWSI